MMKKMFIFVLAIVGVLSFWFAANQPSIWEAMVENVESSFYNQSACFDWQTVYITKNYYVGDDFDIYDTHWGEYDHYAYVYDRSTSVKLIDPYNVFDFDDSFRYISNGKPKWISQVKFVETNGDFLWWNLISGDPDVNNWELVAQVVFNLKRQWFYDTPNSQSTLASYNIWYWPTPNGPQSTASFTDYHVWWYLEGLECFNYVVHYCGDGDVDTAQSISMLEWWNNNSVANEQCDPADPSHEGWGNQWCSNTCEPINQTIDPPTCTLW